MKKKITCEVVIPDDTKIEYMSEELQDSIYESIRDAFIQSCDLDSVDVIVCNIEVIDEDSDETI